jgi:phosphonopyruvate decarboxylase
MITADDFLIASCARKIDFFAGVPCSFLTPLINRIISEPNLD